MTKRITGGRVDTTFRQIDDDLRQLLINRAASPADLKTWCDQIKRVQKELGQLEKAFSMLLPKNTEGQCAGLSIKQNGLLSYAFQIQATQLEFSTNIGQVADRSLRILKKIEREKQENSKKQMEAFG